MNCNAAKFRKRFCAQHDGVQGELYCNDCKVWLCAKCSNCPKSARHKVSKYMEVKAKQTSELSRRIMNAEKTISHLRKVRKDNKKKLDEVTLDSESLRKGVVTEYNRLLDCLESGQTELLEHIEQDKADKVNDLLNADTDLHNELEQLQKLKNKSKEILRSSNIDNIIHYNERLGQRLQTMRQRSVVDKGCMLYKPQTLRFPLLGGLSTITVSNEPDKVTKTPVNQGNMKLIEKFETSFLHLSSICRTIEDDLWFGSSVSTEIVNVAKSNDCLKEVSKANGRVFDITSDESDIVVSLKMEQEIRQISKEGQMKHIINTSPLYPEGTCTMKAKTLLVCLVSGENETIYPKSTAKVVVMKRSGKSKMTIEFDSYNEKIFSKPQSVTENRNSDICVLDITTAVTGRLMVFDNEGRLRFVYHGPSQTKSDRISQFSVVRTDDRGCIFLTETNNHCLHILSEDGDLLQLHRMQNYGAFLPYAIAMGNKKNRRFFWLGCKYANDWNSKSCVLFIEYNTQ